MSGWARRIKLGVVVLERSVAVVKRKGSLEGDRPECRSVTREPRLKPRHLRMIRGSNVHDRGGQLARVLDFEQVRGAEVRPPDPVDDTRIESRPAHENGFQKARVAVLHASEDPSEEQLGLAPAELAGLCERDEGALGIVGSDGGDDDFKLMQRRICMAAERPRELLSSGAIALVVLVVLGLPPQAEVIAARK